MSKDPDLLICEISFHAIGVVSQVLLRLVEISFFLRGFCCWGDQWFVGAGEMSCLKGLQVFLGRENAIRRIPAGLEVAGATYQGDTWDLHRGCCSGEEVRFGDAVPAREIILSRDLILNDRGRVDLKCSCFCFDERYDD